MPATLPTQGRRSVAVLIGSHRQFYRDVLRGVGDYAGRHGRWSICSEPTLFLEAGISAAIKHLPPRCDGVIALVTRDEDLAVLRQRGLAVVNLSSVYAHPDLPAVLADHAALATAALGHFRERGLRQFAFCDLDAGSWVRRLPFQEAVAAAGFECHCFTVAEQTSEDWRTGHDAARLAAWLEQLPKPVGILAHNDIRGRQLIEIARERGIAVPEEVCILGVDNEVPHCELCGPTLSSIDTDATRIGYEAAAVLDRCMAEAAVPAVPLLVPPRGIVTRGSTDVCITADPVVSLAMGYIREHAVEGIDTHDVVRAVRASRSMLSKRFQQTLGYTPHEAIVRARLEAARTLLSGTRLTVEVIAERCGFRHGEYLTAVFRRRFGTTPRVFREQAACDRGTAVSARPVRPSDH
jgi:LacI family transcriptional regulator